MTLPYLLHVLLSCVHTVVLGGLVLSTLLPHLVMNTTTSDGVGLYFYRPLTPWSRLHVGDRVLLVPPLAIQAIVRQVIPHIDPTLPWMKTIAALAGDTVCVDGDQVTINGIWRAARPLREHTALTLPDGCTTLAPETYFVLNAHPRSFDSRYVGALPRTALFGTAMPLYTWEATP